MPLSLGVTVSLQAARWHMRLLPAPTTSKEAELQPLLWPHRPPPGYPHCLRMKRPGTTGGSVRPVATDMELEGVDGVDDPSVLEYKAQ